MSNSIFHTAANMASKIITVNARYKSTLYRRSRQRCPFQGDLSEKSDFELCFLFVFCPTQLKWCWLLYLYQYNTILMNIMIILMYGKAAFSWNTMPLKHFYCITLFYRGLIARLLLLLCKSQTTQERNISEGFKCHVSEPYSWKIFKSL